MALTFQDYTANGTAVSFAIPFDRIRDVHVKVFYESTEVTTGWSVVGNNVIFSSPPPNGTIVRVRRITDFSERLVDYVDGSRLNEVDLDTDSKQAFYLIQENRDINDVSMVKNSSGNWEADFDRIQSVANPVTNNDAANKLYVDQTANNFANYGVGAPATRWAFTGNGTALVFNITGATLTTSTYYLVTVNGSVTDPATYTVTPNTLTFNSAPANASAIVVVLLGYPRVADSITNASISPTAEIAGTKIAPNFGAQNVATTGNIGAGTATPAEKLVVTGNASGSQIIAKVQNSATTVSSQARVDLATGSANSFAIYSLTESGAGSSFCELSCGAGVSGGFFVTSGTTSAPIVFRQSGSERMRINASGNVGIGTSSPSQKLNVSGGNVLVSHTQPELILNNTSSGSWKSMIRMQNSGTNKWEVGVDSSANGNNNLYFYDNAATAERMRISSTGNLLVGTTSDLVFSSGSTDGAAVNAANSIAVSRDGASCLFLRRRNTDGNVVEFFRSNSIIGSISTTATATAYNTSSDYRLKENATPLTGGLATVGQLNPVEFNWKLDGSLGRGFIAHELQAVVPEAVNGAKDAVDAEGNPQYQGVDAAKLVPYLVAAVQELSARVAALEAAQ